MKIRIEGEDESFPLTDDEKAEMIENATPVDKGEAKDHFLGAKEIVLSKDVINDLEAMGMTVDDFVAQLMRSFDALQ